VSEHKRAAVWLVVAPTVGATVQQLTRGIRRANEGLAAAARTDALTGVANRRAWDAVVAREFSIADRNGAPVAIALLDLDRFKRFNDERGHQAGDELLRRTAGTWQDLLRPGDLLARWGGEEFAVLLPGTSRDDAAGIVDRLRGAIPEEQTASAGIAFRRRGESADEVVRRADALLYAAKAAGRDRTAVDGPGGV
jgi:diguanylate cyclase (GGDEF)-like protein